MTRHQDAGRMKIRQNNNFLIHNTTAICNES